MGKALTEAQAKAVWQVLVEECDASTDAMAELSFVNMFSTDTCYTPGSEWRFQGCLGVGGKLRYPSLSVDCYHEDATPERLEVIRATNVRLAALKATFSKESL